VTIPFADRGCCDTTDRALARIATVLAEGELKQPISRALRMVLQADSDADQGAVNRTMNALIDLSCAVDFACAYVSPWSGNGHLGLEYALKRFVDTLQGYLNRRVSWPPVVEMMAVSLLCPLDRRLEHAIFRSSTELLLSALDSGSQACGVVACVRNDAKFLRIWSNGEPWSAGLGKQARDIEESRLQAVGIQLVSGQWQIVDRIARSELLLLVPQTQRAEVGYGET
jgi:hypothetical protein